MSREITEDINLEDIDSEPEIEKDLVDENMFSLADDCITSQINKVERVRTGDEEPDKLEYHIPVPYGGTCEEHKKCACFSYDWPYFWDTSDNFGAKIAEHRGFSIETIKMLEGEKVLLSDSKESDSTYTWTVRKETPEEYTSGTISTLHKNMSTVLAALSGGILSISLYTSDTMATLFTVILGLTLFYLSISISQK